MKNFSFKITDIYAILNQMNNDKKNIDSYLEDKIKQSLMNSTSEDFSSELAKRINLEKEFVKEDIKTFKLAKYISAGFISAMIFISVVLGIIITANQKDNETGLLGSIVDSFSGFIELISIKFIDMLGLSFSPQTIIILILIMIFIFAFSFAEKLISRKTF
ncbi:MAG: hypothetical protein HGGPFJEG_01525 [Ignavibacteria bacterium]|nr:hypothetical protein [Ignavibacteria bacterium]